MSQPSAANGRPKGVVDELLWDVSAALEQQYKGQFTGDGQLVCCDQAVPLPVGPVSGAGVAHGYGAPSGVGGQVVTTTYLAGVALDELAQAQAVIDQHLVGCAVCGTNRPCGKRREAERIFLRYDRLPRRRPGLTSGGVYGADFGWFDGGAEVANG